MTEGCCIDAANAGCIDRKKLKSLREARGLSFEELCALAELSRYTIWRIETISNHRAQMCHIYKLACIYGLKVDDLLIKPAPAVD